MGRAIDMENTIEKHENQLNDILKRIEELDVVLKDILGAVPAAKKTTKKKEVKSEKKADKKGNRSSDKQDNNGPGDGEAESK